MSDTVITVSGLGKRYRIGARQDRHRQFRDVLVEALISPLRNAIRNVRAPSPEEIIWALRDVSVDIGRGEVVGVIGRNGAGKSTLLKIISRITSPTEGRVEIKGRVGTLLEVGTGFHPELTGRENIYLNGAILGMKRDEIEKKFDEMVAFAEIEKFLDTPVKRYSSGMYVRLAFAVAAHLEPEILLVDEVLAVGDASFQKKCLGKMGDVAREGRTILFVSHNINAVARLCTRAILLDGGKLVASGPTENVISRYLVSGASSEASVVWKDGLADSGITEFKLKALRVFNDWSVLSSVLDIRLPFSVQIEYQVLSKLPFCSVGIIIRTTDGTVVFQSYDSDHPAYAGPCEPGTYVSTCRVPANLLNTTRYILSAYVGMFGIKQLARADYALTLDIEDTGAVGSQMSKIRSGAVRPLLEWTRTAI